MLSETPKSESEVLRISVDSMLLDRIGSLRSAIETALQELETSCHVDAEEILRSALDKDSAT